MKLTTHLLTLASLAAVATTLTSCIAEEPLNMECDLLELYIHSDNPGDLFYDKNDTLWTAVDYENSVVNFKPTRISANIESYTTYIRVTEGATAYLNGATEPFQNGTVLDYSDENHNYIRVVSQDGKWERQYDIYMEHEKLTGPTLTFDFEEYAIPEKGKFYEWHVDDELSTLFPDCMWKNGNPGYKLSRSTAKPLDYPTAPAEGEGPDGSSCVKLETRDTGKFGLTAKMPIASGSLFNGKFNVSDAMTDALAATQFGAPYKYQPMMFSVWAKYEPGETFLDCQKNPVEGIIDEPDFYVVVYRNIDKDGNTVILDGNDVLSSPYIVGKARLPHNYNADGTDQMGNHPIHGVTSEWQKFTLPVEYTEELDPELLKNNGYSLIIGFASSWQGAYFNGAIGSKLWIDNIELLSK